MYRSIAGAMPLLAAMFMAATLTGCVVSPANGSTVVREEVVLRAPPAPLLETRVLAPGPGYVWIDGYWNWVGGRHL